MSTAGWALSKVELSERWQAWTPSEVAQRLTRVSAPWYIAAGWALELFTSDAPPENTMTSKSPYRQRDLMKS
jgi:hypothetical protein